MNQMYLLFFALLLSLAEVDPVDPVVATVNGEKIGESEVTAFVQPPGLRIGIDPVPDARVQALEQAIRVRLFAREAARRGIVPPAGPPVFQRAQLNQALIRMESDKLGSNPKAITDPQAREYFDRHRAEMLDVASVTIRAIIVTEEGLAEQLLREAADSSSSEFAALAGQYSIDPPTRARGGLLATFQHDHQGDETVGGGCRWDALRIA